MNAQAYSIDRDLSEARDMADGLSDYVRGTTLYGQIGGGGIFIGGKMPSLTVGALLMRLRRLQALRDRLSAAQQSQLDAIQARNDAVHSEWRVHYEEKMQREAISRLDAMKPFFDECNDDPRVCAGIYPPELLRRTIVQELADEMARSGANAEGVDFRLKAVDGRLRAIAKPDDFQWDAQLRDAYPQDAYWWLYAKPAVVPAKK